MPSDETKSADKAKTENTAIVRLNRMGAAGIVCCIVLFAAAAWLFAASRAEREADHQLGHVVAVLDTPLLTMLQLKSVQDSLSSVDEASNSAADFAQRMNRILGEYREAGILVINKSAALSVPPMNDITPLVAKRLGIDMGLRDGDK